MAVEPSQIWQVKRMWAALEKAASAEVTADYGLQIMLRAAEIDRDRLGRGRWPGDVQAGGVQRLAQGRRRLGHKVLRALLLVVQPHVAPKVRQLVGVPVGSKYKV